MYQALYRKWRPQSFDDVVGQEHITETLKRQLASGRLSHAYLFVGTRGTGKTTCAKILAKAINCEAPENGNPCNKCTSCRGIDSGAILDVEELDAASNNGVDNIRAIRDEAVFTPATVKKRVYIIDEVHMLSIPAFNALLKTLEEPPEHLIFILATTEVNKVPATILSRCQRFTFKRIPAEKIAARLGYVCEQEHIGLDAGAGMMLASLADGSMRDALSLLDQCVWEGEIDPARVRSVLGLAGAETAAELLGAAAAGNTEKALSMLGELYYEGKEVGTVLGELLSLCRDIMIAKITNRADGALMSGSYDGVELKKLSRLMAPGEWLRYMEIIQSSLAEMAYSTSRRITAEMCLARLCDERLSLDDKALNKRLARIEEQLASGNIQVSRGTADEPKSGQNAKEPEKAEKTEDLPPWDIPEPPIDDREEPYFPDDDREYRFDDGDDADYDDEAAMFAPEAPSEPEATYSEPSGAGGAPENTDAQWAKILMMAKNELEMPPFTFLEDKSHSMPEIRGNDLTIKAKSIIAKNIIDNPNVTTVIKACAEKVLGRPVRVSVTDYKPEDDKGEDKLDKLKKFSNIKFE